MKKVMVLVIGGLVLVSMLAATSFVSAAPPVGPAGAPALAATPTLVPADSENLDPEELNAEPEIDPAAVTPVAPGLMTSSIVVFNPDVAAASVSINIVKPDGSSAYAFPTFSVAANGAVVKVLPASLGSPFSGSAVVSSDRQVQAFVTNANSTNKARDTYEGTSAVANSLMLPFVRHLSVNKQHSTIAVQNTSSSAGSVTLHLYDVNGNEQGSPVSLPVQPSASAFFDTNTLFPSGTFVGSAQVVGSSGINIAAAEQTSYYMDTASFRAQNTTDQGTTLYVPFAERRRNLRNAILNWSEIFVRNNGTGPTDVKAEFYPYTGGTAPRFTITRTGVPQNGQAQFLTNSTEFAKLLSATGTYFRGWVKLTSSGQPISLYSLASQNSGLRLFGTSGIPGEQLGTKFACGDTFRMTLPARYSKIVVVNPNPTTAKITVRLYKPGNGVAAGTKTYSLGANKVWQLAVSNTAFGAVGSKFEGLSVISSNGPKVAVTVYTQYGAGGVAATNCNLLQP